MPNHCCNIMRVKGKQEELAAFRAYARGKGPAWDGKVDDEKVLLELDLHKFVAVPEEILNAKKNNRSDAYNSGGYEWCCQNWGTKWGVYDVVSSMGQGELRYDFTTAWSPFSLSVLEAMSEKFPTLEFELKYGEGGMGFGGIMAAQEGEGLDDYADDASALAKRDSEIGELLGISG